MDWYDPKKVHKERGSDPFPWRGFGYTVLIMCAVVGFMLILNVLGLLN